MSGDLPFRSFRIDPVRHFNPGGTPEDARIRTGGDQITGEKEKPPVRSLEGVRRFLFFAQRTLLDGTL